eukprot:TRINITY_DN188_c2_g1_i1.p1 TRINITY_DN188_c2_g1~~TRINITY_DN188_c2_g1_i1.p1  ORF type:complete len:422 (+),score=162.43 TRINITY_DN188_c2_g1_i1:80-1267(+)
MGRGGGGDYFDDGDRPSGGGAGGGGGRRSVVAGGFTLQADELLRGNKVLHNDLAPQGRQVAAPAGSDPIVIAVDVTGSMGDWSKVMYDKLPMFFGQLLMQGYLSRPAISFAGVGDAFTDTAPLQVGEFAEGSAIDQTVTKLFLEGQGGGQNHESYELTAYFYARRCMLDLPAGKKGWFFFTGDEGFYPKVRKDQVAKFVGENESADLDSAQIFRELRQNFHVFLLHKAFFDVETNERLVAMWKEELGASRVLEVPEAKAVVDVMLGAIAIVGGTRTLEEYARDLREKGQDEQRCASVTEALRPLADCPFPPSPTAARAARADEKRLLLEGTAEQVAQWAATLGLGSDYSKLLVENSIDGSVLQTLSEDDLKEIGVKSFGDRRKIKMALQKLLAGS